MDKKIQNEVAATEFRQSYMAKWHNEEFLYGQEARAARLQALPHEIERTCPRCGCGTAKVVLYANRQRVALYCNDSGHYIGEWELPLSGKDGLCGESTGPDAAAKKKAARPSE